MPKDLVTTAGFGVDERIATAHVAWTRERPEVIAEFADGRHGAIGFMPARDVQPGVKVVRVDGRLPGEPFYPLK